MMRSQVVFAAVAAATLCPIVASAATLPAIKAGGANAVPACATPGRLMAFAAQRNPKLDPRYADLATHYMRHGEQLGLRWDYAFFQMMFETGSLTYTRDGKTPGDVNARQNNFAGIAATGKGEPGESFASIEEGVRAHLQHLVMYSGERVDAPVADRTRKVQEWGVLTSWQKGFKRPITYADLGRKWAPSSRGYASAVGMFAEAFFNGACKQTDPRPELVEEARSGRAAPASKTAAATTTAVTAERRSQGNELVRKAVERARDEGDATRTSLGARTVAAAVPSSNETAPAPAVTVLNQSSAPELPVGADAEPPARINSAAQPEAGGPAAKAPPSKSTGAASSKNITLAAAAALPRPPASEPSQPAAQAGKCRVFTASYGGQKSVIISASAEQFTNFTVLDVNEGQESREIEAYVSAYAKGGQKIVEFSNSNAALDRAFQLCPEG